jgi:uncharacterized protein
MPENSIEVKLAIALPGRQRMMTLELKNGATIADAIHASKIAEDFPEVDPTSFQVGIWGKAKTRETLLTDGDRVELYRPLMAEPKEARRRRAATTRR